MRFSATGGAGEGPMTSDVRSEAVRTALRLFVVRILLDYFLPLGIGAEPGGD